MKICKTDQWRPILLIGDYPYIDGFRFVHQPRRDGAPRFPLFVGYIADDLKVIAPFLDVQLFHRYRMPKKLHFTDFFRERDGLGWHVGQFPPVGNHRPDGGHLFYNKAYIMLPNSLLYSFMDGVEILNIADGVIR
ncbi:MAG: hypothetical protein J6X51_05200, partial [Bacteroidales bacterium]|nr:hypothetical protein [Bacteroidales bacterium]